MILRENPLSTVSREKRNILRFCRHVFVFARTTAVLLQRNGYVSLSPVNLFVSPAERANARLKILDQPEDNPIPFFTGMAAGRAETA